MELLERETAIADLRQVVDRVVAHSSGECVLIYGDAGIGKTALARQFVDSLTGGRLDVLSAGCEALHTPRPLGPLVDLADRFAPSLADLLHAGRTENGLFPALLASLRDARTATVLVIEDMHWADAATLDFVRYLGRRLRDVPAVLLLTYRSDELQADHPLRRVLGELPAATTTRIALEPLSLEAVAALATVAARSERSATHVHEVTGGNPFYVTEILSSLGDAVPPSVNDAVMARFARLPPAARDLTERASLFPRNVEISLITALASATNGSSDASLRAAIDACTQTGLLIARDNLLAFRHELARDAVYRAIAPYRRAQLHAEVVRVLRATDVSDAALARLVHHAHGAGLDDEVAQLAPCSARYAAAKGAHREAAGLLALALRHSTTRTPAERATLLEAHSIECTLAGLHGAAIQARKTALAVRSELGDRRGEGINLRWLARLHGWGDSRTEAYRYAQEAVAILETVTPHDAELAIAYSTLSHLNLVGERMDDAEIWGKKAIELAERVGDVAAQCQALACVGISQLRFGDAAASWQMLERCIALALTHQLHAEAAFGFELLHAMMLAHCRYAQALDHAERAITFCESKGIDIFAARIRIRRAFARLQTGEWALAEADLTTVCEHHTLAATEQAVFDFVTALLDLRRGVDTSHESLTRRVDAMHRLGASIWFTSTAAASAECAWLNGDTTALVDIVTAALPAALAIGDDGRVSELAGWHARSGAPAHDALPPLATTRLRDPWASEIAGNTRGAAKAWADLGGVYQQAMALAGGDEADLR